MDRIIVSFTSYAPRINNIPSVLNTIFAQTLKPDIVVLNIAQNLAIPHNVLDYIKHHNIETYRMPDTKVYKKLIPTLKRYPKDIIIAIDDDWLYPQGMIEDFMETHEQFPNNPISGHGAVVFNTMCHCGCASLTKSEFFGDYLNSIDDDVIKACPSDDIVYTYFSVKAGHPYVHTKESYYTNMTPYNEGQSYSHENPEGIEKTYSYLINRFGSLPNFIESYLGDTPLSKQLFHIHKTICQENEEKIRATKAFRIGKTSIHIAKTILCSTRK